MVMAVAGAYLAIRSLPDSRPMPAATVPLEVRPVSLPAAKPPLVLAGAWELKAEDRRFTGLSALAIDRGHFIAVSDRGAVLRFDRPDGANPNAHVADLRDGPGPFGEKWARDAESLARDPQGRGWWVGYEQNHSLWLYGVDFRRAQSALDLRRPDWWNNRGAEGMVADNSGLLVLAENGREAMRVRGNRIDRLKLHAVADVAEAATASDGRRWLLLRRRGLGGIEQSIAPLIKTRDGFKAGTAWPVPKGLFDNYEGMAVEALPAGGLRFWLVSDDGHYIMARTLLIALDLAAPARHDKSPALGTGLSKKPAVKSP